MHLFHGLGGENAPRDVGLVRDHDQGAARLACGTRAKPVEPVELLDLQAHDRYVSAPTTVTARELVRDLVRAEPDRFNGQVGDLRHGDLVPGSDVVDVVDAGALAVREQHGPDDVVHVDVG